MFIKGSFFAARRDHLIREFGDFAWLRLENQLRAESSLFRGPIQSSTLVPFDDYVRFQEAWLERFYAGDEREYWKMGATLGRWALERGPYRHLLASSGESGSYGPAAERRRLTRILGRLWRVYSDAGELDVGGADGTFEVEILDVPRWHRSIEYTAMGFAQTAIETATGRKVQVHRLRGAAEGHVGCRYRFELGELLLDDAAVELREHADSDAVTRPARILPR